MQLLRSILFATKPEYYWVSLLLFLGIVLVILLCWKRVDFASVHEGFQQEQAYLYLAGDQVYSDPLRVHVQSSDASRRYSRPRHGTSGGNDAAVQDPEFVVGPGIGHGSLAAKLAKQGGLTVYGVDKSKEMIESSNKNYGEIPTLQFKQGNFLEPMLWESGSFSHILCTGFTLYLLEDASKRRLLENAFHWLRPGGYLVVQLVDPAKFQTIIPGGVRRFPCPRVRSAWSTQ